nr:MAG TPA: hypothetical protein [Caudoviricetes sp.]
MERGEVGTRQSEIPPLTETIYRCFFSDRNMVEQFFISQLLTIPNCTLMFYFNPIPLSNDFICMNLEGNHWRQISRNIIRCPHFRMNDTVKRPTKLFNGSQAS